MPLIRIDIRKGRTAGEIKALCDAVHAGMLAAFHVPERDRYQIVHEHDPHTMFIEDTGLGLRRTDKLVVISVVSRPRPVEAKLAFYRQVCEHLGSKCGIEPSDVMVSISTNSDADWSFGLGKAQFLTGEL
ncbi:tautomerase family protein [Dyella sp. RRB7]|uniref:tautomerase family protein n=1 Tax=Dyella sp. RRB7 TaxID=2919502 RepID=UPI001FAA97D4|nr:tautomerase family protein [Dyella sp. RRB7]